MDQILDNEIEVKFHINNFQPIIDRLLEQNAILIQPRTHEYNLRFDTPTGELMRESQVLRLRRDTNSRLTFKGPASIFHGVSSRPEYEFTVSNFEMARKFIEALGFQVNAIYEKFRTIYLLDDFKVMLDEMPYGDFMEIEGHSPEEIEDYAQSLSLDWEQALEESYMEIFERIKRTRDLYITDLTFKNFSKEAIDLAELGILPADAAGN